MPSTPMWKLRRLAARAKRVLERRKPESPVLLAYENTLVPRADAFIVAYDHATRFEVTWRKQMSEGHGAVQALVSGMRGWLPLLARDIPAFDTSTFADTAVPDDIIEDAERLIDTIEEHRGADGQPLPYQQSAHDDLLGKLESADKEWSEADSADSAYQKGLAEVRATGGTFDTELQAFRRSLAAIVGRSDKDFQKLRAKRASQPDEDDDPGAPIPTVTAPATPDAPLPN